MFTSRMAIVVSLASAVVISICAAAHAAPVAVPSAGQDSLTIQVSGGCGPNAWRGPWGHCRNTPYHGHLPDGGWK